MSKNLTIVSAEVKVGVLCVTVVLALKAVAPLLVVEVVVLKIAEVDELSLDSVRPPTVDGVEVETVIVTLVNDSLGGAEVVEV